MPLTVPPIHVGASLLAITSPCPTADRQKAGSYISTAPCGPPTADATGLAFPPSRGRPALGAKLLASLAGRGSAFAAGRAFHKSTERGFTLVELIMVISLSGIVAVMISTVMSRPLQGFADHSRRAELTDLAATALNRMARDIRLAVPNSVRNEASCPPTGCRYLEFPAIAEGGRYRANKLTDAGERHDPPRCPATGDCSIPVLSPGVDENRVADARWMVIYNTHQAIWALATSGIPSVITPKSVKFELNNCPFSSDDQCLFLNGAEGFSFQYTSPQHRFYLVNNVLGYRCENPGKGSSGDGTGVVRRTTFDTLSGAYNYANAPLLVDSVSACSFIYEPSTNTRNGLVTLRLSLTKGGETITLLQQVHVDNAP